MAKELVLDALLMAVWRRNPKDTVTVHSEQGSQYTSHDWSTFLKSNNLEGSMSRRGNCHDNAVEESFFQLLKRERIKRKVYSNRDDARRDIFDYIESPLVHWGSRSSRISEGSDALSTLKETAIIKVENTSEKVKPIKYLPTE